MTIFATGLLTGLSLIVAIGAQNAYVLRQGLLRSHVALVVAICAVADVALIALGVLGVGAVIIKYPAVLTWLLWIGAAYLVVLAVAAFIRAARVRSLTAAGGALASRRTVIWTTLALTLLNPHVYLDTSVMLGSLASAHGDARWLFGAGAMVASVIWFTGLGFGARSLSGVVNRPAVWRGIEIAVGIVMLAVAVRLVTL